MATLISWADETFNGWMGCTKVSEACKFCYAERDMDHRYGKVAWGPGGTRVVTSEENWKKCQRLNRGARVHATGCGARLFQAEGKRRVWMCPVHGEVSKTEITHDPSIRQRVFCFSLADVFEKWDGVMQYADNSTVKVDPSSQWGFSKEPGLTQAATIAYVRACFFDRIVRQCPNLDFLILTKRVAEAREYFSCREPYDNVWLGCSIESQERANERLHDLLACRQHVSNLFVSAEPLVGSIDLTQIPVHHEHPSGDPTLAWTTFDNALDGFIAHKQGGRHEPGHKLDWVITGGESGPEARHADPAWSFAFRDQCDEFNVPFHFKQWGEWVPEYELRMQRSMPVLRGTEVFEGYASSRMIRVGVKNDPHTLGGRLMQEVPE